MNKMVHTIFFFGLFLFGGCQLFEDSEALQQKKQELELTKLKFAQERELAKLETQTSLANIEKEKALAIATLEKETRIKELDLNSEKELELIAQKIALQESNNQLNFQMYLFMFLALVSVIISFFVFYYLKRRREDKLQAYNDNLKKYFYIKENEARLQIASQILDTIAEGNLSKENEQKLINAFTQETSNMPVESLEHKEDEDIIDAVTEESTNS